MAALGDGAGGSWSSSGRSIGALMEGVTSPKPVAYMKSQIGVPPALLSHHSPPYPIPALAARLGLLRTEPGAKVIQAVRALFQQFDGGEVRVAVIQEVETDADALLSHGHAVIELGRPRPILAG